MVKKAEMLNSTKDLFLLQKTRSVIAQKKMSPGELVLIGRQNRYKKLSYKHYNQENWLRDLSAELDASGFIRHDICLDSCEKTFRVARVFGSLSLACFNDVKIILDPICSNEVYENFMLISESEYKNFIKEINRILVKSPLSEDETEIIMLSFGFESRKYKSFAEAKKKLAVTDNMFLDVYHRAIYEIRKECLSLPNVLNLPEEDIKDIADSIEFYI